MASQKAKKNEQSFGLDGLLVAKLDWKRALARVSHDLRSDFIWSPHIRFLYKRVGDDLVKLVRPELEDGIFHPGIPLTIEAPKSFRIKVGGTNSHRLGPALLGRVAFCLPKIGCCIK
jgi:hypothetical protein